jgi:hypothetical protein
MVAVVSMVVVVSMVAVVSMVVVVSMVAVASMVVVVNGETVPVVVFGSVVAADTEAKIVIVFVHIIEKKHISSVI